MHKTEAFLAHHGVLGMHWGVRKSQPQNKVQKAFGLNRGKRPLTNRQKDNREFAGTILALGGIVASRVVVLKGLRFLAAHPEILTRASNTVRGTKALGIGHQVVKMGLKNGRYVRV